MTFLLAFLKTFSYYHINCLAPMMGAEVHLTLLITLSVYHEIRDDTDQGVDYIYSNKKRLKNFTSTTC
jgi:hypothetical protein